MKTNKIKIVFAVVLAILAGYNVYESQQKVELPDYAMENVEALASGEVSAGDPCYKGSYDSALPEATKCAHPCTKERCGGDIDVCY